MRYHLKSILKSKLTWTFFLILLISNLYTMIDMDILGESDVEKIRTYYELSSMSIRGTLSNEKKFIESRPYVNPNYYNYFNYKEWLANNDDKRAEYYSDIKNLSDYNKFYGLSMQETMADMNLNANPEEGRPFAENVFKRELEELDTKLELEELPFNPHDLYYINNDPELEQNAIYNGHKIYLKRYFDLILNEEKELNIGTSSPWSLLVQKLSVEKFSTIIISIICLVYSAALILEDKKNRSIKLVETLPKNREYVITHYYLSVLAAMLIILLLSFGIPMLIMGLRHDFKGLNNPVLVYPEGFTSFKVYEHLDEWSYLGLGKYFGSVSTPGYGAPFPSNELVFYPLWKVFALATIPSILKVLFYTLLGLSIVMCSSKNTFAIVITGLFSIITVVSQIYLENVLFNPFSISTGWDLAISSTQFSWLRGITVLGLSWIILFLFTLYYNQKRDFAN